ncbi:MAG: hypothetical protein ACJ76N_04205 [Thermoanaerobaculia bacterium]
MIEKLQRSRGLILLLLLSVPAAAQTPLGPPFRVDAQGTSGLQELPGVAMGPRGDFVVTWLAFDPHVNGHSLFARRFAADGTPATEDILVTDQAVPSFANAAVAVMNDGSFVVVFSIAEDLIARRYGPDGLLQEERTVASRALEASSAIGARGDGGFVLVWVASDNRHTYLRGFGRDSAAVTPLRQVAALAGAPAVAVEPSGASVVAWVGSQPDPAHPRYGDLFVLAQRFGPGGARLGGRIVVQDRYPFFVNGPEIGVDAEGGFVVVWDQPTGANGLAGEGIFARRYAAGGNPLTRPARIETGLVGPGVAVDGRGSFSIAWTGAGTAPERRSDIFTRRFDVRGLAFRPPLRVDTSPLGAVSSRLAGDANGNFVVVWAAGDGIYARLYRKR